MGKEATSFNLTLIQRDAAIPAYRWLRDAIRTEILEGRLRQGARLPATRDLARQYGLSRGTIVNTYEELKAEGYLEGAVGSGTFVAKILPEQFLEASGDLVACAAPLWTGRLRRPLSDYAKRVKLFPYFEGRARAFRAHLPALDLFPATQWAQIAARRLRRASTTFLMSCEPAGYEPLREAIAAYLNTSRGVKCQAAQVLILSGSQEALGLCTRLFVNRGDRVYMEDPGYIGASLVFEASGARVCTLPLDQEGVMPGRARKDARMIYVTPGHQFPLGTTMSLPRRLELLDWARKSGSLIFEDDYDSEYRYSGRPVPALQGLDRWGCVLFSGSFSKVLFPALRLGYLVVPADLVDLFASAQSVANRHAPVLEQAILCDFVTEGHFGRHLRRMRAAYSERLSTLMESARQRLDGVLEISPIEAGLQTVGWLRNGMDAESAAAAAASRGIETIPLNYFARRPLRQQGLQLGFAAFDTREIRRGVRELAVALESGRLKNN